jgi:hypothetical protein
MTHSMAYELKYDIDFQIENSGTIEEDFEYNAWLIDFPGQENVCFTILSPPSAEVYFPVGNGRYGTLPNPVLFEALNEVLNKIDYIYNDRRWPLISKRMLHTLLSVRHFPHRTFPVEMLDAPVGQDKDGHWYPFSGIVNHDFVIFQLLSREDVFDWERSDYLPHSKLIGRVQRARKIVLIESEEGLPPIFQLSAFEYRLFVSHAGKVALEAANITGARFIPIEKVSF